MEQIPKPNTEINPRTKNTQGLDFWAAGLLENKLISQREYDDFLKKNNSKEKMMQERELPQLRHYGIFGSVKEIIEKIMLSIGQQPIP